MFFYPCCGSLCPHHPQLVRKPPKTQTLSGAFHLTTLAHVNASVIPSHLSHKFGGYKSVFGQVFRILQLHQQNVHRAPSSNSCQDAWVIQTSLAPSSSSWNYYIQANICYGALTVSDYKQMLCMYILNSAVLLCWTDRVRRLVPYYTLRTRILQPLSEVAWAVIAYSWVWDLPQLHPALN